MSASDRPFRVASIFDDETVPIVDATMQWIPLRRRLGIQGFGTNAYRAARAGDRMIEDHVESPGQEEMYVVVAGKVTFRCRRRGVRGPGRDVVFLPRSRDAAAAESRAEDDTVVLAVGGWPGKPYHSLPWEPIFLAAEPMRQGDWAAAADTLEREAGDQIDSPFVQFRLACCHAEMGEHERALTELRRAIERRPELREQAESEEHLASLRGLDGWPGG